MADERNPFTLGPKVGRANSSPDLASRVGQFRPPVQEGPSGTEIANALIGFAGIAGDEFIKKTAKKVEADVAVQTALAMEGYNPTDDATNAGYKAHVAVAIKGQTMGATSRLNELASQNINDEEFREAIREEYRQQDDFLMLNYPTYVKGIELQKLAAVSMREAMPQVGLKRAAAKVGFEIEGRINSATDVFVNAARDGGLQSADPKDMLNVTNGMLESLKLTSSQKDEALENAIILSKDPSLVELAKAYTGDRKTSLYTRSGKIQKVEKDNFNQLQANNAIEYEVQRQDLEGRALGLNGNPSSMTRDEVKLFVDAKNAETGNKFMSAAQFGKLMRDMDTSDATAWRQGKIVDGLTDPNTTSLASYKDSEVQGTIGFMIKNSEDYAESQTTGMSGPDKQKFLSNATVTRTMMIADQTVQSNALYKQWVSDFTSLARTNVPAEIDESSGERKMSDKATATMAMIKNMSPTAFDTYARKAGSRESSILRRIQYQKELLFNDIEAVANAQRDEDRNIVTSAKEINEVTEDIMSSSEYYWWVKDIPENQREDVFSQIREMVRLQPHPGSDSSKAILKSWIGKKWMTTESGARLNGSEDQIHELTRVDNDHLDDGIGRYKFESIDLFDEQLSALGMSADDVFLKTDVDSGNMWLATSHGSIISTTQPMSEMKNFVNRYNASATKVVADKQQEGEDEAERIRSARAAAVAQSLSHAPSPAQTRFDKEAPLREKQKVKDAFRLKQVNEARKKRLADREAAITESIKLKGGR